MGVTGSPKNDQEAIRLFKLAAAQGNAVAQYSLGVSYEAGSRGLSKIMRKLHVSISWRPIGLRRRAIRAGHVLLGRSWRPHEEQREAARLFKLAADQGDAHAQGALSDFYRYGWGGLAKNEQEAKRLSQADAKCKYLSIAWGAFCECQSPGAKLDPNYKLCSSVTAPSEQPCPGY